MILTVQLNCPSLMQQLNNESQNISGVRFNRYFSSSLFGVSSCLKTTLATAFRLLDLSEGDKICIPNICPEIILDCIFALSIEPVFIESERLTWNMCPEFLADALSRFNTEMRPKAILVCHHMGMPAQIDKIKQISVQFNLPLIEESSQALGSYLDMNQCGTNGDLGIVRYPFSHYHEPYYAVNSRHPEYINRLTQQLEEIKEGSPEVFTVKQIVNHIKKSRSLHELLKTVLLAAHKLEILDETSHSFSNKEVFAAMLHQDSTIEEIFQALPLLRDMVKTFPLPNHLKYPALTYSGDHFSEEIHLRGFYIQLPDLRKEDIERLISFT